MDGLGYFFRLAQRWAISSLGLGFLEERFDIGYRLLHGRRFRLQDPGGLEQRGTFQKSDSNVNYCRMSDNVSLSHFIFA